MSRAEVGTLAEVAAAVDARLQERGLSLTLGAEPTLIACDHEHPEWNTAALGPTKLACARRLARALRRRLAPGALVLHTQGKLYPGEPLPRWVVSLLWRKDGAPLADESQLRWDRGAPSRPAAAAKLVRMLPRAYGLDAEFLPVFPDAGAEVPPPELDPLTGEWITPRLSRAAQTRLRRPLGWVLPIDGRAGHWTSPRWRLPGHGRVMALPGSGPLGFRLPLHRLPERSSRRAMTLEVRDGELRVFLPPVESARDYFALLNPVLAAAATLKCGPLVIEGYAPPHDPSLERLGLAADPGVLEINVPPCGSTAEFAEYVDAIYECGAAAGLRAFKYQYTGRKIGTGGGAHLLLGGPTLEDNPFFRDPRLLTSFIRFVQHHPSLSYVFTGLFTGPSSQAPRVDESEFEVPYELELALRAVESGAAGADRWRLDRMLRHLLMDTVGNTHRAEICIDKFWNPAAPNGQLGLLEFRAFEMPPTAPMLVAAAALLRGLAAVFAERPFTLPLVDWGGRLHDEFGMPHFLARDFREVLGVLRAAGFGFHESHFEDWFAFRFPLAGLLSWDDEFLGVRHALEPWPLLGEQSAAGGTARSVDASTDRLELRLTHDAWARGVGVRVNGVPVHFLPDPAEGVAVAAVRYRMFDAPFGLQPQIPGQSPLRIDVVDTARGELLASAQLHNWRPDQQSYAGLPQDDVQAQARRDERFQVARVRRGTKAPAVHAENNGPGHTLDLRRFAG